jgi:S-adenosylmethionine synthetase
MKRRDFLSLTARTAAALTAVPVATAAATESARHGGIGARRVTRADDFVVSAEAFLPGHPDKLADLIADTITDTLQGMCLGGSHGGAIEVFASRDLIVVGGSVSGPWGPINAYGDVAYWGCFEQPIRDLLRETGHGQREFTVDPAAIEIRFPALVQCFDIARGVAGDPGPEEPVLVYGYATDETPELMPLPTLLAQRLARRASEVRQSGALPWLLPHRRAKVAIRYVAGQPVAIDSVDMTLQHQATIDHSHLLEGVMEEVIRPVVPMALVTKDTRFRTNAHGHCVVDGLIRRCGVSGRSLAADTYGAHCPLPAVGLAGQGTENLQRSGALMARYVAKQVVAAGLARRCTVHLAYRGAQAEPEAVLVDTHGTGAVPERRIERGIRAMFPLTPWGIFEHLDLGRPIYRQAAAFGYFGWEEPDFTWERVDRVSALTMAG